MRLPVTKCWYNYFNRMENGSFAQHNKLLEIISNLTHLFRYSDDVTKYNIHTGESTVLAKFPYKIAHHACAVYKNKVNFNIES